MISNSNVIEVKRAISVNEFISACEHLVDRLSVKLDDLDMKEIEFYDLAKEFKSNRCFIEYCFYFAKYDPNVKLALAKSLSNIVIDFFERTGVSSELKKYVDYIKLFTEGKADGVDLSTDVIYKLMDIEEAANTLSKGNLATWGLSYNQVGSFILCLAYRLIMPNYKFDDISYTKLIICFYEGLQVSTLPDLKDNAGVLSEYNNNQYVTMYKPSDLDDALSSNLKKIVFK